MEIWREINQATVVYFPLIDRGTLDFENTPPTFVAADCQFSIDKGAFANTGSTPVHEGNGIYSLDLLAAEVNGQNISITVIDSATKLWEDQAIIISTYGSASAEHAVNLNDIVRAGLTALPNFAADAAGGLPVSDLGGLDLDAKLANTNEITVARMGALTDWIDAGRLDLILDIIAADVVNIDGQAMRGTNSALLAASAPTNFGDLAIVVSTGLVSVGSLAANIITAASINAAALTAAKFAAGAIDANALNADAVDKIRDGLLPTQNAAFNNIEFLFVAASDGRTPVTAASGMAVTRSIDGGAFGAGTGTGPAEVGNGIYQYDASAADMNGGIITFRFVGTGGTPGAPDDRFITIVTGGGV